MFVADNRMTFAVSATDLGMSNTNDSDVEINEDNEGRERDYDRDHREEQTSERDSTTHTDTTDNESDDENKTTDSDTPDDAQSDMTDDETVSSTEQHDVMNAGGQSSPPPDVAKYARFKKVDGAQYDRINNFLRDRTYITAREWAIARLCSDFRTETGVEMTKIGANLPQLIPFMTDTYTPQAVNQARSSFEEKVTQAGATFLYGAMSGFFTADELDELMYEVTETAKFLLEVEGVDLSVADELEAEDRISTVMREVREASDDFRANESTSANIDSDSASQSDGSE
ncbi:MAG: hypothetical protein J07HQW2_02484 [Haloquadratum walsbyi J07HQW2]|jgi:hypothetical protein|uniref:Uncharacterized protein n=2 Tax=Haloquadratum walsbyi TaxID=293091 RepID=U1PQH6_9EURY|nr:MAG: hypothetical protein J07HQW2_02484 [Haloquadratum walsbyi J07HQW2]